MLLAAASGPSPCVPTATPNALPSENVAQFSQPHVILCYSAAGQTQSADIVSQKIASPISPAEILPDSPPPDAQAPDAPASDLETLPECDPAAPIDIAPDTAPKNAPCPEKNIENRLGDDLAAENIDPDGEIPADEDAILVEARAKIEADPLSQINADSFEVVQNVDEALVSPVSKKYESILPKPIRSGIGNFLSNLTEPVVALNYLLQLKPKSAVKTLARFTVNSTVGVGGILDVAKKKPFHLPHKPNGFANTLGRYGVKPGAYLYLPLVGSTTVRDLFGGAVDLLIYPTFVGKPFNNPLVTTPIGVITGLNDRIERDDEITRIRDESDDSYAEVRDIYLARRQAEINEIRGITAPAAANPPAAVPEAAPANTGSEAAPTDAESITDGGDQISKPGDASEVE